MQYEVIPTPRFEKDLKRLGKKNRNISDDIQPVLEELEKGDFHNKTILMQVKDNKNVAIKIRVADVSRNGGKSGAYRLICYAEKENGQIFLLTMYAKNERDSISNREILELILKYCID